MVGVLAGMALSGWMAERLLPKRQAAAHDSQKALRSEGLDRIRLASLSREGSETMAAEYDTLAAFSLPKGMYEFAMRKQIERTSSP
jgi:hypothetical protein